MILGALSHEEYNKVARLEVAKEIWDTLHVSHEGIDKVRKSKIELLMAKLNRFVMREGEGPQEMFDRMMTIVNKIRGLGCEDLDDHSVVKKLLNAFASKKSHLSNSYSGKEKI